MDISALYNRTLEAQNSNTNSIHDSNSGFQQPELFSLHNPINLLNQVLHQVIIQIDLVKKLNQNLQELSSKIENFTNPDEQYEITTSSKLISYLCKQNIHSIFLRFSSSIPNQAYKSRNFNFSVETINSKGFTIETNCHLDLEIQLYTYDNPPRRIMLNNSGFCAIRFKLEKFKETYIFKNVSLSEVSSRVRNGVFFFVVVCKNNDLVKPLVIEDFKVKSRKNKEEPKILKKKVK